MQGMEGVTFMGFTRPNGSAQGVGEQPLESGDLYFPSVLLLDQNGEVFIDAGTDRNSSDDIDIRITFDEDAVKALFDDGEDYVLEEALRLMHGK